MKKDSNQTRKGKNDDFLHEYDQIINFSENTVVVDNQWEKDGDYFKKLTIYDNTYIPVKTLGSTTLIFPF
ncbi:hypothetical protein [Algoriphagus sp.]|uniref:hypothetical protein n=1 Tax=Algoriphagus sp. TaxID=1872435 RepID=UPI00329314B1